MFAMFKQLFDFLMTMKFKQTAFCLFTNRKDRQGQILQNTPLQSAGMWILSCLSSEAEKPQKWMQICLFYHPEYTCVSAQHVCAQAMHYARQCNSSSPACQAARERPRPASTPLLYICATANTTRERWGKKILFFFEVSPTISLLQPTSSNLLVWNKLKS